jgi:DHA1 family bicyclomycin/chloramphenicol resistance-like MFS transporter
MTISSPNRSVARLAILLGTLTAFGPLSIDFYLPGLPAIAREFQTGTAAAQQTLAVFFIGLALGQAFYGPLSDRFGRRQPLLFGCVLYALASLGCAFAPSIQSLVALRFAQALGGCAGIVVSRSIVRDLFDERESARMYSFLILVLGLAPITAPLIGGQILALSGWRTIFFILSGFGVVCSGLVLFVLAETLPVEGRTRAGFGAVLRIYGSLLADGRFMGYALAGGLASGALFAYVAGSPFVFIELNGVPPERFGLLFGGNAFGLILASQFNRRLLERYYSGQILTAALAVIAISGLLLAVITVIGIGGFAGMLVVLFCCIASMGLVLPNATAMAMAPFGRQAGSASALLGALQFAIGAAAGTLVGVLDNGTALPMVGIIACCGVAAYVVLHWMTLRPLPGQV